VSAELLAVGAIALLAAAVNGGLGYGFSSLTVPVALLFLAGRVLNPAMVLVEVGANVATLLVNRRSLGLVVGRLMPVVAGVLPGVAVGSCVLLRVSPDRLKLVTYVLLLPLILLQAAGRRRPVASERALGPPFGFGIGFLYSMTTISGPPLAAMLNNQGYAKEDFRAALGLIRTAESAFTACGYYFLGLFTPRSLGLAATILPSLVVGVPLGAWLIRRVDAETFRRVCMSFDAWVVGFGLSKALASIHPAAGLKPYVVLAAVAAVDAAMLTVFFSRRRDLARAVLLQAE
jgi:uncharacterized membrane protein YfcA